MVEGSTEGVVIACHSDGVTLQLPEIDLSDGIPALIDTYEDTEATACPDMLWEDDSILADGSCDGIPTLDIPLEPTIGPRGVAAFRLRPGWMKPTEMAMPAVPTLSIQSRTMPVIPPVASVDKTNKVRDVSKTQVVPVLCFREQLVVLEEMVAQARAEGINVTVGEGWTCDTPPRHAFNLCVMQFAAFRTWFEELAMNRFARLSYSLAQLDALMRQAMIFQLDCLAKALPFWHVKYDYCVIKLVR